MAEKDKYYIVKKKALPEVLRKVVEAKRLIDSDNGMTVQEATEAVDLSRSSFYKYKDDIFPFHENNRSRTINIMLQLEDQPGLLSGVLDRIAKCHANILTIHQTIPIGGIATITLGIEIQPDTAEIQDMLDELEQLPGVGKLKILGRD